MSRILTLTVVSLPTSSLPCVIARSFERTLLFVGTWMGEKFHNEWQYQDGILLSFCVLAQEYTEAPE